MTSENTITAFQRDRNRDEDAAAEPPHHLRSSGAGIKRRRIEFVPASVPEKETDAASPPKKAAPMDEFYLDLVMPGWKYGLEEKSTTARQLCPVCSLPLDEDDRQRNRSTLSPESAPAAPGSDDNLPDRSTSTSHNKSKSSSPRSVRTRHETSIAHQACLAPSHPPSTLDRSRMGLAYLAAHGWDPDGRVGLGAPGRKGIAFPLKPTRARGPQDNLGVGVPVVSAQEAEKRRRERLREKVARGHTMSRAERRELGRKEAVRAERVREEIFGNSNVEKYLGGGGGGGPT